MWRQAGQYVQASHRGRKYDRYNDIKVEGGEGGLGQVEQAQEEE